MFIVVQDDISLTEVRPGDRAALLEHLQAKEIHDHTLMIPFPYTPADADRFLEIVRKLEEEVGRPVIWAIRNAEELLVGVIGFKGLVPGHLAEIGYWLAKPWWGRGIMTAAVRTACACAFLDFGLGRIWAHVFPNNPASARVLEKCGFKLEGYLRRHFRKGEEVVDAKVYGLLRDECDLLQRSHQ